MILTEVMQKEGGLEKEGRIAYPGEVGQVSLPGYDMPGIVEFPQIVQEALETYRDVFSCEPQRRQSEYTGRGGRERRPFIGTGSKSWGWERVSYEVARARQGTCTW